MNRVPTDFPPEIEPLVAELNALIEHTEAQSEAARRHAGKLAHALKTPMAVLMNEAMAREPDLSETVIRETGVQRPPSHPHPARARAHPPRPPGTPRPTGP